ncbi:MAG: DUF309 domain-containing protein [Bacteroidota bacterium]
MRVKGKKASRQGFCAFFVCSSGYGLEALSGKTYLPSVMKRYPKKSVHEIDRTNLAEPSLDSVQRSRFREGIDLFNRKEFWEAHEAWEEVWMRCGEESRIFFQGIIQAAAAYHLILVKKRFSGALSNIEKSRAKLGLFPGSFLGMDVDRLRSDLNRTKEAMEQLGPGRLGEFSHSLLPHIDVKVGG